MEDFKRLKRVLVKQAQKYAPHLIYGGWEATPASLRKLARDLAECKVLVIKAAVPPRLLPDRAVQVERWVGVHAKLYFALTGVIFPSRTRLDAAYADGLEDQPIVVLRGESAEVLEVMAGLVVPYIARAKYRVSVPDTELHDIVEQVLDALECGDLPQQTYSKLHNDTVELMRMLLENPLRQESLTDSDDANTALPLPPGEMPPPGLTNRGTGPASPASVNGHAPRTGTPGYDDDQPFSPFAPAMPRWSPPSLPSPPSNGSSTHEPPPELPRFDEDENDSRGDSRGGTTVSDTPSEQLYRVPLPPVRGGTGRLRPPVRDLPNGRRTEDGDDDNGSDIPPGPRGPVRGPRNRR